MAPEAQQAFKDRLEKLLAEYALVIEHFALSAIPFRKSILDDEHDSIHLELVAIPKSN
jgi:hypothetical protein